MQSCSIYRIDVSGELDDRWTCWFAGAITLWRSGFDPAEEVVTVLTTPPIDMAGLHGLLAALWENGIPLLSVERKRPALLD